MPRLDCQFRAHFLSENVDRYAGAATVNVPERPTVTCLRSLDGGPYSVDRSLSLFRDQAAVGSNLCGPSPSRVEKHFAGSNQAPVEETTKGYTGCVTPALDFQDLRIGHNLDGGDATLGEFSVFGIAFDTDKPPLKTFGNGSCGARAKERIQDKVTGL